MSNEMLTSDLLAFSHFNVFKLDRLVSLGFNEFLHCLTKDETAIYSA